jgi:hypothetical protein
MQGLLHMASEARIAAEPHAVTYVDFLTVTLTAVCAILTALAIIIAIAAIWGYAGIKKELTEAVAKRAEESLDNKLKEYPDAREYIDLLNSLRSMHENQKRLSDQLVTKSASKSAPGASKGVPGKARDQGSLAKDYPGKGE